MRGGHRHRLPGIGELADTQRTGVTGLEMREVERFPKCPVLLAVQHRRDPSTDRRTAVSCGDLYVAAPGVLSAPSGNGGVGQDVGPR